MPHRRIQDPGDTSTVDQLNRETFYDALDNVKSVTRTANTAPVMTSYNYEPTYNQLATVKDPLNRNWTIDYDSSHNPNSITDPLGHASTLLVAPTTGLLSWVTDPVGDKTQFFYNGNFDLDEIIDLRACVTYRNDQLLRR